MLYKKAIAKIKEEYYVVLHDIGCVFYCYGFNGTCFKMTFSDIRL